MKRRYVIFFLILACMFSTVSCFSESAKQSAEDVVVCMRMNEPMMQKNGVPEEIDVGRGTVPIIRDGRTLIPIRAVIEAFDGTVAWEEETKTIRLSMDTDEIELTIDHPIAYLNGEAYSLDVAPTVIRERTMLPIRFIAEGFGLGVAWNPTEQTVSLVRQTLTEREAEELLRVLPEYQGSPYTEVNGGIPFFEEYEKIDASFEYYSRLDDLGRCNVCMASIGKDLMPEGERESISSVHPSGWVNASYDRIEGGYLYNRCHLIGYQLTGENANARNLITGTRYLNISGMLPLENRVDRYIEETGNHVLYRVTPIFQEKNLVADGVLMEAYSVEDRGAGLQFCVYCHNVQPEVTIDYTTGESSLSSVYTESTPTVLPEKSRESDVVYRTPAGKRYHFSQACGGKNSYAVTTEEALSAGLTPCGKCVR